MADFHVFLSFKRKDTADTACSLYKALKAEGIKAFFDKNNIRVGDELNSTIIGAIKRSLSSIIVFSPNYPYSAWCLNELEFMIERCQNSSFFIIPIFYEVEPQDIKHQLRNYGHALEHHRTRHGTAKVESWKRALTVVGNIFGEAVGSQSINIQNVVEHFRGNFATKFPQCPLPQPMWSRLPSQVDMQLYMAIASNTRGGIELAKELYRYKKGADDDTKNKINNLIKNMSNITVHENDDPIPNYNPGSEDENNNSNDEENSDKSNSDDEENSEKSIYRSDGESGNECKDSDDEEHPRDWIRRYDADSQNEYNYSDDGGEISTTGSDGE